MLQHDLANTRESGALELANLYAIEITKKLDRDSRSELGQFMTPSPIASFMASLFRGHDPKVRLLDPGAGVGSLTAAFVEQVLDSGKSLAQIQVDAFELDKVLQAYLTSTLARCRHMCQQRGVRFIDRLVEQDFIRESSDSLFAQYGLFGASAQKYTHCIANPPYKKLGSNSLHRKLLRSIGIETTNLYSAFLAIAIELLDRDGEIVAIVPRSFCNGVYFRSFRRLILSRVAITRIHVFNERNTAFRDDSVLQENIVFHAVKGEKQAGIVVSTSDGFDFQNSSRFEMSFEDVVKPDDPDFVIHIPSSTLDKWVSERMQAFKTKISELGVEVSTGRVVDFRQTSHLRQEPEDDAVPLVYPSHFTNGFVSWPKAGRKPNAISHNAHTSQWLMPIGWYVLTRRFSAKEEKKRIYAAILDPDRVQGEQIGIENHLNIFHQSGKGLPPLIAKGLAVFLNSTLVDLYFRQFSGHTQVNASDLRMLGYPTRENVIWLGSQVTDVFPNQKSVDKLVEALVEEPSTGNQTPDPIAVRQKIADALVILKALGMPRGQINDRSAVTLLVLLGMGPNDSWAAATNPLLGITPIMETARALYGTDYAPNTRETFRRETMHQFIDAGFVIPNPDQPNRAVNSPKYVYQIEQSALALFRSFDTQQQWEINLSDYLSQRKTLVARYARERTMNMVPLSLYDGETLYLSPGEHSQLIKEIIEQFGPRFAPGAEVLYIGDTGSKVGRFDESTFAELELSFDSHGKFPDVVLYLRAQNWLFLVEAVTSHGPMNPKRHAELTSLFANSTADCVFVTAFPDRAMMARFLNDISWETEVWIADAPTHMIHFDGLRFLGPKHD